MYYSPSSRHKPPPLPSSPITHWLSTLSSHLQPNIHSTISLFQSLPSFSLFPSLSLITQSFSSIYNNNQIFSQNLKSVIDEVEILCRNSMITGLKRVGEGKKSIVASTSYMFQEGEAERDLWKGGAVLMGVVERTREKEEKRRVWKILRQYQKQIDVEDSMVDEDTEDNHQLMKFFAGVRQYQSYQEELATQAIQKLKLYKDNVGRQRAMIKGFNLSRWETLFTKIFARNKRLLFTYFRRADRLNTFGTVCKEYESRLKKDSLRKIKSVLKRKTMLELLEAYKDLVVRKQLLLCSKLLKKKVDRELKLKTFAQKLYSTSNSKLKIYHSHLLCYLNSLPNPIHQKLLSPLVRITSTFLLHQKRRSFKKWKLYLPHSISLLTTRLQALLSRRASYCLTKIQQDHIIRHRPLLSLRAKGKIVASVIRVSHDENMNVRRSFLKWWLKVKPKQVEKRFMHMFLHAPTRSFTYFLRLKNIVKESLGKKVGMKSVLFAMVLKDKSQRFLRWKEKEAIKKWWKWNKEMNLIVKMSGHITKLKQYYNEQNTKFIFKILLQQFDSYNNRKSLMTKMFNIIGGTSIGKVIKALDIWKKLPDQKDFRKKRLMLNAINKGLSTIIKQIKMSFQRFKQDYLKGDQKKRSTALVMIKSTKSGVVQMFKKWQDSMRVNKTVNKCRLVSQFLEAMTQASAAQYSIVLESSRQRYLKEKYLTRMIQTQTGNISRYILIFYEVFKADNMSKLIQKSKRKLLVQKITNIINNRNQCGVKGVLNQLYKNYKVKQKQVNFMKKIMQTKVGRLLESIKIWKALPEKDGFLKIRNGHKFFSILKKSADKVMVPIFKDFVCDYEAGQIKKRGAMGVLLAMSSSDIRKYYIKWHSESKKIKTLDQCKLVMANIECINTLLSSSVLVIFESRRISQLKLKCFTRMMQNLGGGIKQYLHLWSTNAKKLKFNKTVTQLKQQNCVSLLTRSLTSHKSSLINLTVHSLHKNLRIKQISKLFFNKLLDTQSGKILKAIHQWSNLPKRSINKLKQHTLKLFNYLLNITLCDIRHTFNQFKAQHLHGESKQKHIVNKLITRCMNYEQKKYIHWKILAKEIKLMQKVRLVGRAIEGMNRCVSKEYGVFFEESKEEMRKKEMVIIRLVNNNTMLMRSAMREWKKRASNKCYERYQILSKLVSVFFSKTVKREAFNEIKLYTQLEQQRVYINSIWKWRTSQLQSTYHSKFLLMMSESQLLTSLTTLFTSKLNNLLSTSFNTLKQHLLNDKLKYSFVKKYYLRKLQSYLERFKQKVKDKEMKRWKGKYEGAVRGTAMLQAMQKVVRKVRVYELRRWRDRVKTEGRKKEGVEKIGRIVRGRMQWGWGRLRENERAGRVKQGVNVVSDFKEDLKRDAFSKVLKTAMLMKIINIINKKCRKIQVQFIQKISIYSQNSQKTRLGLTKLTTVTNSHLLGHKTLLLSSLKTIFSYFFLTSTLHKIISSHHSTSKKCFLLKLSQKAKEEVALIKIKAAHQMYTIYENIHHYVVSKHFTKWKKMRRESVWLRRGVEMFATKPDIRSTLAISMWRMKVYTEKEKRKKQGETEKERFFDRF